MMKVYAVSCKTPQTKKELDDILSSVPDESGSLVCFPEYFLCMEKPDDLLAECQIFAANKQIYLALGMLDQIKLCSSLQSNRYLTGILIDKSGKIIGRQQKLNPTSFEIKDYKICKGVSKDIISAEFGTVEIAMCKDQWYFRQIKSDSKIDAEIVLHLRGFGLNDPKFGNFYDNWLMLDRTTAMLSKAYLIGTTGADKNAPLSDIIDFEGNILAESDSEGIITASIDLEQLRKYRSKEFASTIVPRF